MVFGDSSGFPPGHNFQNQILGLFIIIIIINFFFFVIWATPVLAPILVLEPLTGFVGDLTSVTSLATGDSFEVSAPI